MHEAQGTACARRWDSLVPRRLSVALLVLAVLVGDAMWFLGYAIQVHAGICDLPNCPSDSTAALGRTLRGVGVTIFGLSSVGVIGLLLGAYRRRQRGRPPAESPRRVTGSRRRLTVSRALPRTEGGSAPGIDCSSSNAA